MVSHEFDNDKQTNKVQLGCLGLSDNSQLMVNWWFGLVFWDSRRSPTQQSLAEGDPRNSNYQPPNQHFTIP